MKIIPLGKDKNRNKYVSDNVQISGKFTREKREYTSGEEATEKRITCVCVQTGLD